MRYVIAICVISVLIIWDFGYNDARYIRSTVKEMKRITDMVGV